MHNFALDVTGANVQLQKISPSDHKVGQRWDPSFALSLAKRSNYKSCRSEAEIGSAPGDHPDGIYMTTAFSPACNIAGARASRNAQADWLRA